MTQHIGVTKLYVQLDQLMHAPANENFKLTNVLDHNSYS